MTNPITGDDLRGAAAGLGGWDVEAGEAAILRVFKFGSFGEALAFMVEAGLVAEKADHHPEWRNVYNRVEVRLTTHDAGGVTEKDIDLARAMDRIAAGKG